jgi:hypothetical protein
MRKIASLLAVTFAVASGSALALNEAKETKENAQLAPAAAPIVNPGYLATDPTMTSNTVDPTVKKAKKKKTLVKNETMTTKPALKSKTVETPGQSKGEETGGAAGSSGSSGSAGNGG